MSGKGASVGASRTGVPGAPRVLVYVADPRQLEPAAVAPEPPPAAPPPSHLDALYLQDNLQVPLPRNSLYRNQVECSEQRNQFNTVYYKPVNETDNKLSAYSSSGDVTQPDYISLPQQYIKDSTSVDEVKVNEHASSLNPKVAGANAVCTELSTAEFPSRIPLEVGDLSSYQRCSGAESTIPMHSVSLQHNSNQFGESAVNSGGDSSNCDRVSRSYVNYQFLEQSVSHQSIVNQSISILNQQVGVSRSVVSEGDSGSAPQLVRTADGVVLAVLPSNTLPQSAESADLGSRTALSEPQTIVVPLGWRRIINGSSVLYISPSGTALSALPQLREYLQTTGTCKCGLPCPLRPETAFSFDPKVGSKPYQVSQGAELTKLCNHKRKLLASLQSRANSPATPPPQNIEQKKVSTTEVPSKKKMKKRTGFPPNLTVSQLMVQRERPLNDFKPQNNEYNRTISPGIVAGARMSNSQSSLHSFPPVPQNIVNNVTQDNDIKQESLIQRSSHYLTVSSGWITQQQQENLDGQKLASSSTSNNSLSVGLPVLGTNGQVIGVNTGFNKNNTNYKNVMGVVQQNIEQEFSDEKKDNTLQQSAQPLKKPAKEEESQIFCGLNQPLTPEVMQKINEQQQIFIQQNQKQIEMAMKGFRTQLAENVNQTKSPNQTQYVPQGQLVIQNGAVVKTNPAKTPPWQVKRNDSGISNSVTSPNFRNKKIDSPDHEESNTNISDESIHNYNTFSNNEHTMNPNMCSRVPPLPQHYNMLNQQWPNMEATKKKVKSNSKGSKKKTSTIENKIVTYGNNGIRVVSDSKNDIPNNNVPSFMDDPNGYLAQQTVLLNNTISRQVGMNSSYDVSHSQPNNCYYAQNQTEKMCKVGNKACDPTNNYRNNLVPNPSPSPNNTPDSSVLSEKGVDNLSQCCKGCNISIKAGTSDFTDNQMRMKYMKQNAYKMELDGASVSSSPKHNFDDNPVTSSTYLDRSPMLHENCSPIQAGTVSTSNVSPTETLQPPEPSPTPSNSSRSTDTPHSSGPPPLQPNCAYPLPGTVFPNIGAGKNNCISNSPTLGGQVYPYNSPGLPNSHSISGTQMMHFISNHNVNKNLMEVDNISMVGVKPGLKHPQESYSLEMKRRIENAMPGYCPPPHLGGGPAHSLIQTCYVQTFVTTMASGFSVTRDTVTSVLAGKANTATTSINAAQANFVRPPPPPSVNLATTYAIPNNQPDPFINSVNLPTSYPLHIAGTTAQNMISKSPLEMVQNVIGNVPPKSDIGTPTPIQQATRRNGPATPGQILISSTGQIIVSSSQMPPPPPKTINSGSPIHGSSTVSNVTSSITQVVPAVGGSVQPIVNQPTVVVNTLPAPFVLQQPLMAVDGQVVQQNAILPQIVTGSIVPGQSPSECSRQIDVKNGQGFMQGVAMLSPESLKKRNKKKKSQPSAITNVLQITAPQQNANSLMVHHTSPQQNTSPQFSPRSFQLSPNNNISPTPMLQALTIVPGKTGTPAHIVMNGQGNANNFGSQQIINTSPSQQINLLQPVNLINNASNVMPNFPAFQQFIVPNLGGMVMTADGTAIIQDNSTGMPMQLQLQTVNGQNVLTPVQNQGVFATGSNGGVVIRAQNQQGKIIQSQHSPGAQFLSPNSQVMMNSPNFNGQLSPLLANLSPTSVTFNANTQVRSGMQPQEYIQANQMGQVVVPLSPKQVTITTATNRANSTFVQQNTTIVQQQTTLVSNSHTTPTRLSIDANVLLAHKQTSQRRFDGLEVEKDKIVRESLDDDEFVRHSVSTQTLRRSPGGAGGSAADTTTHSPPAHPAPVHPAPASAPASAPAPPRPARSAHPPRPDTTTDSPEPADATSSAMVQCVSSSEQDMAESREHSWPPQRNDFDSDTQNLMSNVPLMRQSRHHSSVESSELHYSQSMNTQPVTNPHSAMPIASNYYDRNFTNKPLYNKRKNEFGDGSNFRNDKIMRTNFNLVHGLPKENDYDGMEITSPDKNMSRQYPPSGSSTDTSTMQKVYDRNNIGAGDDGSRFAVGDVVWGPARGRGMWPGALCGAAGPAGGAAGGGGGPARWRVRWFGGLPPPPPLPAHKLLTLSEGLDAHHRASTAHRKSRKLNTLLENAIQEAMAELDKKSERSQEYAKESANPETIEEAPKRNKKSDKVKTKDKNKKKKCNLASSLGKSGESTRLRSSR